MPIAIGMLAACGFATGPPASPVPASSAHPHLVSYTRINGNCVPKAQPLVISNGNAANTRHASDLPSVHRDVTGAAVLWLPGTRTKPCRSAITHVPGPTARKIARLIDTARPFPRRPVSCGLDDNASVVLYLISPPRTTQIVTLRPTGCLIIQASGFRARYLPVAVMSALARYAPEGWAADLRHGV